MTRDEAAAILDGREYRREMDKELAQSLKDSNLVAVYGQSDDIMVFAGSIDDEFYDTVYLKEGKILKNKCEEGCAYFDELTYSAQRVDPNWGSDPFVFDSDIVHSTFKIMEDGDQYCQGIVFSLGDVL